jgi:hypothetical protein
VDEQAGRGRLGPKSALQGRGNQFLGHGSHDVPAHHLLADRILIGTQVSPVAVGQGQISDITDPDLVSLRRLGLVKQPVGGSAQPVGRVGGAGG